MTPQFEYLWLLKTPASISCSDPSFRWLAADFRGRAVVELENLESPLPVCTFFVASGRIDSEQKLAAVPSAIDYDFGEFGNPKGKSSNFLLR